MAQALARHARYLAWVEALLGRLVAAFVYPLILLGVLFLLTYALPRFSGILDGMGSSPPLVWLLAAMGAAALLVWRMAGLRERIVAACWRPPGLGSQPAQGARDLPAHLAGHQQSALPAWTHRYYRWHRPHHGINLMPPTSRLSLSRTNVLTLHILLTVISMVGNVPRQHDDHLLPTQPVPSSPPPGNPPCVKRKSRRPVRCLKQPRHDCGATGTA